MNMIKRLMALLLAVLMCGAVAFAEPAADDVMMTVNGAPVTRGEYEEVYNYILNFFASYNQDTTDPSLIATVKGLAISECVDDALIKQKVVEFGLNLTETEKEATISAAQADWNAVIEDGLAYYGITAESTEEERATVLLSVLAELESMGYTEETHKDEAIAAAEFNKLYAYLSQDAAVEDQAVIDYYNSLVEADKAVYENDAAAYEQVQQMNQLYAAYGMADYVTEVYYKPAGYRLVTHILLSADEALLTEYADLQAAYEEQQNTIEEGGEVTGDVITAEAVENARLAILANVQPTVDEINQKLADGATFAELIPQYTTDPGMMDEAAIAKGYEVHMDSVNWVIPFRDQAFTVNNIGDVTAPVVTDYGVHILQYVADVPAGGVELTAEMHAAFKASLLAAAQDEAYYAALETWVNEAVVEYSDEAKDILGATETAAE